MGVGVLFDLDGTLLNTLEDLHTSVNHVLREFGCPERTVDEVRRFVGNGAEVLIRLALPGKENDPPVEQVLARYQQYYNTNCRGGTAKPYAGVAEALSRIAGKYPVAIVSNKPDPAVKALCKAYFGDVYARGVTTDCPRKPAADMLQIAMDAIGADRCVYIGDSEVDVLTAKNAKAPCLCVLWGFRDRQTLLDVGGNAFCESPAQLEEDLEKLIEEYYGK